MRKGERDRRAVALVGGVSWSARQGGKERGGGVDRLVLGRTGYAVEDASGVRHEAGLRGR